MARSNPDRKAAGAAPQGSGGSITPVFPLLLLQTLRDLDRPEEVLEDEDVSVSLPRRLGLSDVVGRQIVRLQEDVRRRRALDAAEVENLIRLVVRRPDAEAVFLEAGRRVARRAWDARARAARRTVHWLPRPVAMVTALRAAKRLLGQLTGSGKLKLQRRPVEMRISGSLTAQADPGGTACAFYSGVLEELLNQYTNRSYRVLHSHCEAHGEEACEWTVRVL